MNARACLILAAVDLLATPLHLAAAPGSPPPPEPRPVGYPQYPSLSPDGRTLVFAFGGDLWAVESDGGVARRITSHPADELRSAFSPDGRWLAFESERDGTRNLFALPVHPGPGGPAFGEVVRVTTSDRPQTLAGFTPDSGQVLFSANLEPAIVRGTRLYRAPLRGPGPTERLTDAFGSEPVLAADGSSLWLTRGQYDPTRPRYAGSGASDLWRLDLRSGAFTRLTRHPASDAAPAPLPGGAVAFVSSRDGQNNLWRLPPGAVSDAEAVQLTTFKPGPGEATLGHGVRDFSVAPGGATGVFVVWDQLYTVDLRAAKPKARPVTVTVGGDLSPLDFVRLNLGKQGSEAALSPDGKTLAVVARGEIFVRGTEKDRPTRRVTASAARKRDLAWSPDGGRLYFASDETGVYGIYAARVDLAREDLEPKKPQPGAAAGAAPGEAAPAGSAKATPTAAAAAPRPPDPGKRWAESVRFRIDPVLVTTDNHREPRPSPDGRKLLVTRTRGDLVLLDVETGAQRLLLPGWDEAEAVWFGDSRHVVYSRGDEWFNADLWLLDTQAEAPEPVNLTRHPDSDVSPRLSADGKVLYFLSDRSADSNSGQDRGGFDVYALNLDRKLDGLSAYELADYFKAAAEKAKKRKPLGAEQTGARKEVAGGPDASPAPGAAAVDPAEDAAQAEPPSGSKPDPEPLKLDLEEAHLRVRRVLAIPGGAGNLQVAPGGERLVYSATADGTSGLYSVDFKGKDRKTIATASVSRVSVNLTGEKVVYLSGGEASIGRLAGGETEKMDFDAPVTVRLEDQQRQKFLEAARLLGEGFYHPTLKGLDWPALTHRYLPLALATRTDSEFNRVVRSLFGELDGSHLGISGGRSTAGTGEDLGYLGLDAEPANDGWRVRRVIAHGPADRETSRLNAGDVIVEIDGRPVAAAGTVQGDLPVLLSGRSGRETLLKVRNDAGRERQLLITPVASAAEAGLRYDDEVKRRAAMVHRRSGGQLGYLHIRSMDLGSVRDFERDLYAAAHGKAGLIIDVRNNGGGWTTDILLASLTAPRHAYTVARGADPATMPRDAYPRDRRLIYAYQRPLSVLINEDSKSNAEIFPHAIKTVGRGKLVGTATYGAVISTGSASLIDGSTVRMPTRGWHLLDDTDMENHGAQPDLDVPMTPEAEVAGSDPQIEAAVEELLERARREPFWSPRR